MAILNNSNILAKPALLINNLAVGGTSRKLGSYK